MTDNNPSPETPTPIDEADIALQDAAVGEAISKHEAAIDEALEAAKHELLGQLGALYYHRAKGHTMEVPHHVVLSNIVVVLNPEAIES